MTAPDKAGHYISYWMLRDPNGNLFGLGPDANWPIYVDINVGSGGTAGTPAAGATPAGVTPTVSGSGNAVTQASLTVDSASANTCP